MYVQNNYIKFSMVENNTTDNFMLYINKPEQQLIMFNKVEQDCQPKHQVADGKWRHWLIESSTTV